MNIQILPSAMKDLGEGKRFYDSQEPGIGDYFQDCLLSDIDSLGLHGGIHRQVFGYHRMLSKRFPFAIYYRVEGRGSAVVYRVLDCRRDPKRIQRSFRS